MKRLLVFPALACMLFFAACTSAPDHPEEAVIRAKLLGSYCSDDAKIRFVLSEDGRYMSRRNKKNAFASGVIGEKCEGNYSFKYNEDSHTWTLEIAASDKNSNPFIKCKAASIEVWQAEKGYLVGENPVELTEPFEQTKVSSIICEDI